MSQPLPIDEEYRCEREAKYPRVPIDYDCSLCGRPFVPRQDGASSWWCADCESKYAPPSFRATKIRFPYKQEGDRIVVDADALEMDKNKEDQS